MNEINGDKIEDDDGIKVILLGETGVGKTNIINIATNQNFEPEEKTTIASSFSKVILKIKKKQYQLNIWDTIGQEQFRQLTKLFYNNSKIVIFVYDITSKESFNELKNYWVKDIESKLGNNIIKGLIANKSDLFLYEQVKEEEGEEYAKSINAKFLMFSAKDDSTQKIQDFLSILLNEVIRSGKLNDIESVSLKKRINSKAVIKKRNCC